MNSPLHFLGSIHQSSVAPAPANSATPPLSSPAPQLPPDDAGSIPGSDFPAPSLTRSLLTSSESNALSEYHLWGHHETNPNDNTGTSCSQLVVWWRNSNVCCVTNSLLTRHNYTSEQEQMCVYWEQCVSAPRNPATPQGVGRVSGHYWWVIPVWFLLWPPVSNHTKLGEPRWIELRAHPFSGRRSINSTISALKPPAKHHS